MRGAEKNDEKNIDVGTPNRIDVCLVFPFSDSPYARKTSRVTRNKINPNQNESFLAKEKNVAAWRNGNPTFLSSWDEITEEALTSKPLYAHFADYLAKEYTDRSGKLLGVNTAVNYLNSFACGPRSISTRFAGSRIEDRRHTECILYVEAFSVTCFVTSRV